MARSLKITSSISQIQHKAAANAFFGVFKPQGTCPVAASVVLFLLNEILTLKQMRLFLNSLYVTV